MLTAMTGQQAADCQQLTVGCAENLGMRAQQLPRPTARHLLWSVAMSVCMLIWLQDTSGADLQGHGRGAGQAGMLQLCHPAVPVV